MSDENTPIKERDTDPATPRSRKISQEVKRLSRSEKARNYLIGLGAASALILGLIQQFRGEPVAEKTWETLRSELNDQAKAVNKIQARLVYFQAWQEARTAMEIQNKLDLLQGKYDAMVAKQKTQQATTAPPKPAPKPEAKPACKEGLVEGSDGKCHQVRKAVAKRVKEDAKRAETARKALEEEKRKRLELERRKSALMKKLIQQTNGAGDHPKPLKLLPKNLDDAVKK